MVCHHLILERKLKGSNKSILVKLEESTRRGNLYELKPEWPQIISWCIMGRLLIYFSFTKINYPVFFKIYCLVFRSHMDRTRTDGEASHLSRNWQVPMCHWPSWGLWNKTYGWRDLVGIYLGQYFILNEWKQLYIYFFSLSISPRPDLLFMRVIQLSPY